ncbi:MAG: VCBS repeat-containing protein, partial [Myxococcota bacterium]|nr:VCBS repeat-containing protein [Myxococcota bacterium]
MGATTRMMRLAASLLPLFLLAAAVYVYTQPDHVAPDPVVVDRPDGGLSGEEVAQRYCQNCHALPRADRLPKETWPFLITWMGNYLGYERLDGPFKRLTMVNQIPTLPVVSKAEMSRLGQYFIDGATLARDFVINREPEPAIESFDSRVILGPTEKDSVVTLVHVDELRGWLWIGTANDDRLRAIDLSGNTIVEADVGGDPIHIEQRPQGIRVVIAGDFAKDNRQAQVIDLEIVPGKISKSVLLTGLHRTIEVHTRDLDADGLEDLVVVSFGDGVGSGLGDVSVYWTSVDENGEVILTPQPLLDRAGGLGAQLLDLDEDGRLDVLVLATQGNNDLIAYLNRGDREFERRVLIERGP